MTNSVETPTIHVDNRRKKTRRILFFIAPVVVGGGIAYEYLSGARYVETENAYVKASKATISAQVSGPVYSVVATENQAVKAGDVLFVLDDKPFKIALDHHEAVLQQTINDIKSLEASYRAQLADLRLAESDLAFYEHELARQQDMSTNKMVAEATLDQAKHLRDTAQLKVNSLRQNLARTLAALGGDPDLAPELHPNVKRARADRDNASLDLAHTVVTAPFSGVTHNMPQLGDFVRAGTPVMSIISTGRTWIEANFKETELTYVRDGQPVSISIDGYPNHEWKGKVQSISQATGSEFSVLPPQNATGNWVKVVQRIPVRIAIDAQEGDPEIRAGMSAQVEIDTGYRRLARWFSTPTTTHVTQATTE